MARKGYEEALNRYILYARRMKVHPQLSLFVSLNKGLIVSEIEKDNDSIARSITGQQAEGSTKKRSKGKQVQGTRNFEGKEIPVESNKKSIEESSEEFENEDISTQSIPFLQII
ncbi:hypothetical protein EDC94DRAFT_586366 [Helicostylum pulchrum]|nr:hypothetical protein EDC94DRAFT_586366 [Helicostylum pulchrum]